VAVPNGSDENGMPIGIQIMAPYFGELKMLAFAQYLTELNRKSAAILDTNH